MKNASISSINLKDPFRRTQKNHLQISHTLFVSQGKKTGRATRSRSHREVSINLFCALLTCDTYGKYEEWMSICHRLRGRTKMPRSSDAPCILNKRTPLPFQRHAIPDILYGQDFVDQRIRKSASFLNKSMITIKVFLNLEVRD